MLVTTPQAPEAILSFVIVGMAAAVARLWWCWWTLWINRCCGKTPRECRCNTWKPGL